MGQCYYELGNYGSAKGYLLKAYMVEGKEIFEGEDDKYIKFVAQIRWLELRTHCSKGDLIWHGRLGCHNR